MKRREFITLLGGAAAWPLAARAQQPERARRIGVLMNLAADDPQALSRITAFVQGLQQLGWTEGRNMRIDTRWGAGDAARFHRYAEELLALAPDVVLASGTPAIQALQQATRTVPIVFAVVGDPVGATALSRTLRSGAWPKSSHFAAHPSPTLHSRAPQRFAKRPRSQFPYYVRAC